MNLSTAKEIILDSPLATQLFAFAADSRGRICSARGMDTSAIRWHLRGLRARPRSDDTATKLTPVIQRLVDEACYESGRLLPIADNRLRRAFVASPEATRVRQEFMQYDRTHRVRLRYPRPTDDPERQGDLIVLKRYDECTSERGVILVAYTEAIRRFAAMFDLQKIAERYVVVLEPSSWGYEDTTFLLYLGSNLDVVVQSPWKRDFEFITSLESNLIATRIGAGDWVDGDLFRPLSEGRREYDLAMVSSWHPVKRHKELFRAMRTIRQRHGRTLRVALVGYPAAWSRERIERLAERYAVRDSCEIMESIPAAEVARIVSSSRAYILLSKREGANRALYEAMFCDTPSLVYRWHRGVNTDHIVDRTGILFEDDNLDDAILRVVGGGQSFSPRRWALENTGYENSTRRLNDLLAGIASSRGLPWTRPIVPKKNSPNLRYAVPGMWGEFAHEYDALADCLIPDIYCNI